MIKEFIILVLVLFINNIIVIELYKNIINVHKDL